MAGLVDGASASSLARRAWPPRRGRASPSMSSSLLSRGRSVSPPEDRRDPRAGRREPRRVRVVGREARMEVVSGAAPRRPAPFWRVVTIRTVLIDDRHLTPRIADLHFFLFCILTSSSHRLASLPQVGDNIKGADTATAPSPSHRSSSSPTRSTTSPATENLRETNAELREKNPKTSPENLISTFCGAP